MVAYVYGLRRKHRKERRPLATIAHSHKFMPHTIEGTQLNNQKPQKDMLSINRWGKIPPSFSILYNEEDLLLYRPKSSHQIIKKKTKIKKSKSEYQIHFFLPN